MFLLPVDLDTLIDFDEMEKRSKDLIIRLSKISLVPSSKPSIITVPKSPQVLPKDTSSHLKPGIYESDVSSKIKETTKESNVSISVPQDSSVSKSLTKNTSSDLKEGVNESDLRKRIKQTNNQNDSYTYYPKGSSISQDISVSKDPSVPKDLVKVISSHSNPESNVKELNSNPKIKENMKKSDANDNQPDGILVGFQSSLAERTRSEFFEFQQLDNKPKNLISIGKCNMQNLFMMVFFVNSALKSR